MTKKLSSFVFEGHSGATKTPTIGKVEQILRDKGIKVTTCAPFALADDHLKKQEGKKTGLYDLWAEGDKQIERAQKIIYMHVLEAEWRVMQVILESEEGVVLLDREWLTVVRGVEEAKFSSEEKRNNALRVWQTNIKPTFIFRTRPEITAQRPKYDQTLPWKGSINVMQNDFDKRDKLVEQNKKAILETYQIEQANVDLEPIVDDIIHKILNNIR